MSYVNNSHVMICKPKSQQQDKCYDIFLKSWDLKHMFDIAIWMLSFVWLLHLQELRKTSTPSRNSELLNNRLLRMIVLNPCNLYIYGASEWIEPQPTDTQWSFFEQYPKFGSFGQIGQINCHNAETIWTFPHSHFKKE